MRGTRYALYVAILPLFTLLFLADQRLYSKEVWMVQETLLNGVRFGMALELAGRTFRAFPGARSTLNVVVMVVVAATLALALPSYDPDHDYVNFVVNLQPRLLERQRLAVHGHRGAHPLVSPARPAVPQGDPAELPAVPHLLDRVPEPAERVRLGPCRDCST